MKKAQFFIVFAEVTHEEQSNTDQNSPDYAHDLEHSWNFLVYFRWKVGLFDSWSNLNHRRRDILRVYEPLSNYAEEECSKSESGNDDAGNEALSSK